MCSFVLVLPWGRWCLRSNHFRTLFEEAILEQTEKILENEIQKAAADVVASSLSKPAPEDLEKTMAKEKILLNMNTDWEEINFMLTISLKAFQIL